MTNLCLTLAESTLPELERKLQAFQEKVPYIEVRLDYLDDPIIPRLPTGATRFIATCRPPREGGRFDGSEVDRIEILKDAARAGFHYIDVEYDVPELTGLPTGSQIIRSSHLFEYLPNDLAGWLASVRQRNGDIHKLAAAVSSTSHLVRLLNWMENLPPDLPRVVIGMGEFGQLSRYFGGYLGNLWTYVVESDVVAPGQFSLAAAQDIYGLDRLEGLPSLFPYLTSSGCQSVIPVLFNRLFQKQGLNALCVPIVVDDLAAWLEYQERSRLPYSGVSLGASLGRGARDHFSTSVLPRAESVDTLSLVDGKWEGFDYGTGALLSPLLKRVPSLEGAEIAVLGCGAEAVWVAGCLKQQGADVVVVGNDTSRLEELARQQGWRVAPGDECPASDICVNATSIGEFRTGEESRLNLASARVAVFYDLVYNPKAAGLSSLAEASGAVVIPPGEMVFELVRRQFMGWVGYDPDGALLGELVQSGGG